MNKAFDSAAEWDSSNHGFQIVVMTYSPLDMDIEPLVMQNVSKIHSESMTVKFIQLHELKTSSDLNSELDHFFNTDDSESLLVVLCDPNAASVKRIHYAQYTCENKREVFIAENPQHIRNVLFVVNLTRGVPLQENNFTFDFDKRWKYLFIDDVLSYDKTSLPGVFELASNSLSMILEEGKNISLMGLVLENTHNSLSRIIYPYPRTSEVIQRQIRKLREWLSEKEPYCKFYEIMKEKILELLKITTSNDKNWFLEVIDDERLLQICGTLNSSLKYYISKKVYMAFAATLSVIDRLDNFSILTDNPDTQELWLDMFQNYIQPKMLQDVLNLEEITGHINVLYGSVLSHFEAQFPFSYLFAIVADSLRKDSMDISDERVLLAKLESRLEFAYPNLKNYVLVKTDSMVEDETKVCLPFKILERMIHDYHNMFGVKLANIKLCQLDIVYELIYKHLEEKGKTEFSLAEVQTAYWMNENRIRLYFQILDIIGSEDFYSDIVINLTSFKTNCECDMLVYRLLLNYLSPEISTWDELNDNDEAAQKWVKLTHILTDSIKQLQELMDVHVELDVIEYQKLNHLWKCISLFSKFMEDLAFKQSIDQDALDKSICKQYWENYQNLMSHTSQSLQC